MHLHNADVGYNIDARNSFDGGHKIVMFLLFDFNCDIWTLLIGFHGNRVQLIGASWGVVMDVAFHRICGFSLVTLSHLYWLSICFQ